MSFYKKLLIENQIENYAHCQKANIDLSLVNGPYVWDIDIPSIDKNIGPALFQKYAEPPEDPVLLRRLADYEGIPEENLMLTPGADIAIELVYRQFMDSGDSACVLIPTFPRFEIVLSTIAGVNIDFRRSISEILENYKLVCLCTPNNPTTKQLDEAELIQFIKKNPDTLVCIDSVFERYGDFSLGELCTKFKNLIVLKSFSKIGLAGIRLGYIISHPENIHYLKVGQSPFPVPLLIQKIGIQILNQINKLDLFDQSVSESFHQIKSAFKGSIIRESRVPFYLLKCSLDSTEASALLLEDGISVVDGKNFRGLGNKYLRVALGTKSENYKFIESIFKNKII